MARAVTLHEMEPMDRLPVHELRRPAKTSGPVDGGGHAMFGWRMEEEAKVQSIITVNWQREDGSITTTQLGTLVRGSLPLGRRCGFATRGRQANSRAITRNCGQRTTATALRSCAAVCWLSWSAPLVALYLNR